MSRRERQERRPSVDGEGEENRRLVESHASPGLKEVFASASGRRDLRILDLGPSVAANFELLSVFARRIQFVGLVDRDRPADGGAAAGLTVRAHDLEVLTAGHAGSFDIVFAWDVLNYLVEAQAREIVANLAHLCRPGARLMAIVYESDTMPASPSTFKIVDEASLAYERASSELRGGPQLPPAAIERLLTGFAVEHTFVLRHGVREYVAVRR